MSPSLMAGLMAFFVFTGATGHAAPAEAPQLPEFSVAMTGYNAVPSQTDEDPLTTASGAYSNPSVVAARSRDLAAKLPFGTVIAIDSTSDTSDSCGLNVVGKSIGYRVIADTMNARMHNKVDILFPEDQTVVIGGKEVSASRAMGSCEDITIRVVGKIDLSKASNLPKTQSALVALVGSGSLALK